MIGRIRARRAVRKDGVAPFLFQAKGNHRIGSIFMKWETPQATDFRFGMEITMYIAKR